MLKSRWFSILSSIAFFAVGVFIASFYPDLFSDKFRANVFGFLMAAAVLVLLYENKKLKKKLNGERK